MNVSKLDSISFKSLDAAGVNWRALIKDSPALLKKYKEYLQVKSEWVFVNIDYSQLELYVLASISGDKDMIATVNSGEDLHSVNTQKMTGMDYKEYDRILKSEPEDSLAYVEAKAGKEAFKTKRKSIKGLSFSLTYGAGEDKISMDQGITRDEAKDLIKDFYTLYPKVKEWQNSTFYNSIKNGYLETPFGRRRATPKIHNRMDAYEALVQEKPKVISALKSNKEYWTLREEFKTCKNTPIQSVASDMCSWAACKIKNFFKTLNGEAEFYFWVHDSVTFAVKRSIAADTISRVMEIMENEVKYEGDPVRYRTSIEVGYNYEWVKEIERDTWMASSDKLSLIDEALEASLDMDVSKKFKIIIKSTSLAMDDKYVKTIKDTKMDYFERLVSKLNIDGIYTPEDYMIYLNGCTREEYREALNISEEFDDD